MASHDSGNTISAIRHTANSQSTGLVQSILALGVSMLVVMAMLPASQIFPHPEERHLRRVSKDECIVASWFETALTRLLTMRKSSHPKQPRIARLDFFRHLLDPAGVFLHQFGLGKLLAPCFGLHLRVNRILRGEVGQKLLDLACMQPGLKQFR